MLTVAVVVLAIQWRSTADALASTQQLLSKRDAQIGQLTGPDSKGADSLESLKDAAAKAARISRGEDPKTRIRPNGIRLIDDIIHSITTVQDRFQSTK
jgi:hypothetical protein